MMTVDKLIMPCHWCAPHMDDETFMFQIYDTCDKCDGDGCDHCGENFNDDCNPGEVSHLSYECPECYQDIRQTRAAVLSQIAHVSTKKETPTMKTKTTSTTSTTNSKNGKNMTGEFKAKVFQEIKKADKKAASAGGYFKAPVVLHLGHSLDSDELPLDVVRPSGIRIDKPSVIAQFLAQAVLSNNYLNVLALRLCDNEGKIVKEYSGDDVYKIIRDWVQPVLNSSNQLGWGKDYQLHDLAIHALRIDANKTVIKAKIHAPVVNAPIEEAKAVPEIVAPKPQVIQPGMEFLYGTL